MVRVIEVGPRDGLQNEPTPIPTSAKVGFIRRLAEAGLTEIEATSFVSPKWVPQLGDAEELWPQLPEGVLCSALVPNARGLERAISVGVTRIALFTATSDAFTQRNINMTVEDSLALFRDLVTEFRSHVPSGWIRGYLSTAFECPYAGRIPAARTTQLTHRLLELGVDEVSLGDTIGVAVPSEVADLGKTLGAEKDRIAWHFHDTRGTAVANVSTALNQGFTAFDSSAAGLGGCPYAPGAGGNLATEDLVYLLERSGIPTGIDLQRLSEASLPVLEAMGKLPTSKSQVAKLAAR